MAALRAAATVLVCLLVPCISIAPARAPASSLRGVTNLTAAQVVHSFASAGSSKSKGMPCNCVQTNPSWTACTRAVPRCVFIDLGAADGNSFNAFLSNEYGNVGQCPSVQWSAILVEANPMFDTPLKAVGTKHGQVTVESSTAAYMCEASTSFYIDKVNHDKNYWGSSMSDNHPDVKASGKQKVTVPTVNLNRMLFENTIPGDYVIVKMDIEGAEYDVLPCVADSPSASLIDRLFLEQHSADWGNAGTTPAQMEAAKAKLRQRGVDIPDYFSQTL